MSLDAGERILLLGATGLVGAQALEQALRHPRVAQVFAPMRRPSPERERLFAPVVDFADLDAWPDVWSVDVVLCCLGATIRVAGSRERFIAIDHDAPVEIGVRARAAGARVYALVSAIGADPDSWAFYSRVKGRTERDVAALGFPSTIIVRPGILDGDRAESRPVERAALAIARALAPALSRGWRASPVANVARAMLDAALAPRPGVTIIPPRDLA